jgi:two-component system, sensor histidine kinase and response regulator
MNAQRGESRGRTAKQGQESANPDDFVSMVSHELRGGFAAIAGLSATLAVREAGLTKNEVVDIYARLQRQCERLGKLIEDLLDVHQLEAGRFSVDLGEVDLRSAISQALESMAGPTDTTEVVVPAALTVVADERRLIQVLANLLDNAFKYGELPVRVEASVTDDGVLVSVTDSGTGVPEELIPHLFEKFRRGDVAGLRGSGLGLAITLALVQSMGASIWYEVAEPRGAKFNLLLAAVGSSPEGVTPSPSPRSAKGVHRPGVILVVDDEPDMRFLVQFFLKPLNKDIVEVTDGAAALDKVRALNPALIITDLMMPVMDGQELIKRVRAESEIAHTPVLLLSANPDMVVGADAVLRKPVDPGELLHNVRVLIGEEA